MLKKVLTVLSVVITLTLLTPTTVQAADYCGGGPFKSWMPMGALSKRSAQYKYLINYTTDRGDGLLVTNDGYIAVAMGPHFGSLGDKYILTFANGQKTKVVHVDTKAHYKPGCERIASRDGSLVEVILSGNPSAAFSLAKKHGNAGKAYAEFAGTSKIINVERIGKGTVAPPKKTAQPVATKNPTPTPKPAAKTQEEKQRLMIVYIPDDQHRKLLFLDTEFSGNNRDLVQAALLVLERVENDSRLFYLTASLNAYVNIPVTEGFEIYTNIKQGFLANNGISPIEMEILLNEFIDRYNLDNCDTLVIAHGLEQDLDVLNRAGCQLLKVNKYDTFLKAKQILGRNNSVSLPDIVKEAGILIGGNHDAYTDAFALIAAFSQLKLLEDLNKATK